MRKNVCAVVCGLMFAIAFPVMGDSAMLTSQYITKISQEDWNGARSLLRQAVSELDRERENDMNATPDPFTGIIMSFYVSVNHASAYVELALVELNCDNLSGAIQAMRNAVYLIDNSRRLCENNASDRATKFLQRLQQGSFEMKFTSHELFRLSDFIMAIPKANWDRNIQASINLSNAIIDYCDSRTRSYQYELDRIERQALQQADYEYYQNTGRDFDPGRRPSDRQSREEWDYCNKIHMIFN